VDEAMGCLNCCSGAGCLSPDCFEKAANCMDCIAPFAELLGKIVGCFASPCAWPLVYCFQADGDLGRPWDVQMEYAPCKQPHVCCCSMCCVWCMQFEVRRMVLDKDMSKYKLFQGYYDGPYGCARWKPSLPFTLTAGTYGDAGSPLFLALEVCLCPFCAFDVSREYQREDRALGYDPTEIRVDKCLEFFRCIAELCLCCGFCVACVGCCAGCCLGEKDVEQSSYRLGGACLNIAQGIIRGMRWVIRIATACMSAQMCHEHKLPKPDVQKPRIMGAPEQQSMGLNRFVQGPTGIPTPPPRPSPTPPPTANPATTPAPTPSPTPAGNPGDCDQDCTDVKTEDECKSADSGWSMCSGQNAWWHSQCMATCSKCASGKPPCSSSGGGCDDTCTDLKSQTECSNADQVWSMCSRNDAWWHAQCKATCGKCTNGNGACGGTSTPEPEPEPEPEPPGACDVNCKDVKSQAECLSADQVWNMCSGTDTWWHVQCRATCSKCLGGRPPCNQATSTTCDLRCTNAKSTEECRQANQGWNMCSITESWWTKQCVSFCGHCEDGRQPCTGKLMDVSGELDIAASVDDPDKYVTDAFVNIAMKDTVASIAGHGVETTHVTGLEITFTNSSNGRRLTSVAGNLVVKYVVTVPEDISDEIASALQDPTRDVRQMLQFKLALVEEGARLNVTSVSASTPKRTISKKNGVIASTSDASNSAESSFFLGLCFWCLISARLSILQKL